MIEIRKPTKLILIEIIEGLLSKKYSRAEVVEWQEQVCRIFDYYGPGVLLAPLKNDQGYWYFVSLSVLLEKNPINSEEEYFIREKDLQIWLNDLRGVEFEKTDAQVRKVKIGDKKNWKKLVCLLRFKDDNNVLSSKDESFNFERGIFDNLADLTEEVLFEYKDFRFGLQKSYKHFLGLVDLAGEEDVPEIIVADLLEHIEIELENLIDVNETLYKCAYKLVRMDDNGIKCVINENINYFEAYLRQKNFEKGTHKQTYWVE